jgi:hypothetical protein
MIQDIEIVILIIKLELDKWNLLENRGRPTRSPDFRQRPKPNRV